MAIIEFIIALIFIFLLISLFVSWIIDIYASRLNRKGRFLEKMLIKLLGEDNMANWTSRLYRHPIIESLSYKNNRLTSLIPAELFSQVIADLVIENGRNYSISQNKNTNKIEFKEESPNGFMNDIKTGLEQMDESDFKRNIRLFFEKSENDSDKFLKSIESWFNEYMVRVNYTYKRLLKTPLCILGIVVAISFNIDAIRITTELWTDTQLTSNISMAASEFVEQNSNLEDLTLSKEFFEEYKNSLILPVGWKYESNFRKDSPDEKPKAFNYWLLKIVGFVLTGMIASFGAPFWYDALQKIVGLKKSMKIKTE